MNIVGSRPNLIKIAPFISEMNCHPEIDALLVHTGQHYNETMSGVFFRDLEIPKPDICLNVGTAIVKAMQIVNGGFTRGKARERWDGQASRRIVAVLLQKTEALKARCGAVRERARCLDLLTRV